MTRKPLSLGWEIAPVSDVDIPTTEALYTLLRQYAADGDILLVHAVDGVIWGRVSDGQFLTSHDVDPQISPELRIETLQQLRLFNHDRELHVWRNSDRWQAQQAADFPAPDDAVLEECHILWGTKGTLQAHQFTLLEDGAQGLRHIVPMDASRVNERDVRACMWVRHYLSADPDSGAVQIAYSRLAGIGMVNDGEK